MLKGNIKKHVRATHSFYSMSFRLPCTDFSVDTRLSVIHKPKVSSQNECMSNCDEDCVLTLSSCWKHDDKKFVKNKIQLLEKDVYATASKLTATTSWTKLLDVVQQMCNVGCLSIVACGHKFSGVPLLYTFMTTGFKCPICRFGDNVEIDITSSTPDKLCPNVWTTMCMLADVVRKRDILEKTNEDRIHAIQVSRQTISVVYQAMPWVILFVLYKENNPTMASTPYAQIPIKMTVDTSVPGHSSAMPGMINLSAGTIIISIVFIILSVVFMILSVSIKLHS